MSELLTTHGLARFLEAGPDVPVTYDYGSGWRVEASWAESSEERWLRFLATEPEWNPAEDAEPARAGEGGREMVDIETRIKERGYQTPGRARAAIKMSQSIKGKERSRLEGLVDEWENEGAADAVVGGVPASEFAESAEGSVQNAKLAPIWLLPSGRELAEPITVSLNARIRARLTPYGVSLLYAARGKVAVPANLMAKQGVWEIELWEFIAAMGDHLSMGDDPVTENNSIELLTR